MSQLISNLLDRNKGCRGDPGLIYGYNLVKNSGGGTGVGAPDLTKKIVESYVCWEIK